MSRVPQVRSLKTRESILASAERLMARQGLNSLTMEAVAAEADVSKGGVLHHFRSKEALITGLVARKTKSIREGSDAEERKLGDQPNRVLRGMIRHSARQYGDEEGFPPALLVAGTQNSESLAEIHALLEEKLARIRSDSDRPEEAAMLVFATLGVLLSRALGFSSLSDDEAQAVFRTIEAFAARQTEGPGPEEPRVVDAVGSHTPHEDRPAQRFNRTAIEPMRNRSFEAPRIATPARPPVREHVVTDATESFLWRRDDYPWERNVWNIHPEYEIHLVRNASGVALVGDHIEPFEPGYLTIVGSGLPHDWVTATAPGEIIRGRDIVLQFDADRVRKAAALFPEFTGLGPFLTLALRGLAFHGETRRLGAVLLESMNETSGIERLTLFFRLLHVLAARGEYRVLSSTSFAPDKDGAAQSTIQSALAYIFEHFTRDIRLADLSARFGMSEWAFSRFFKKNSGNSFIGYVTTLRLGLACKLLADSDRPVTEICFEIGYANVSNFNRTFRRHRGMTPSAYRRLARQRLTQRSTEPARAHDPNDFPRPEG